MNRKTVQKALSGLNLLALGGASAAAFQHLSIQVAPAEFGIAALSVAATALVGLCSVYIARRAKALTTTRRIFISYSWEEKDRARELRDLLEKHGAKVWFDENDLQPGSDLKSSIAAAIESSNAVVAVMSAKIGTHLGAELRAALDRHVPIYALLAGEEVPAALLEKGGHIRILKEPGNLQGVADTVIGAR